MGKRARARRPLRAPAVPGGRRRLPAGDARGGADRGGRAVTARGLRGARLARAIDHETLGRLFRQQETLVGAAALQPDNEPNAIQYLADHVSYNCSPGPYTNSKTTPGSGSIGTKLQLAS